MRGMVAVGMLFRGGGGGSFTLDVKLLLLDGEGEGEGKGGRGRGEEEGRVDIYHSSPPLVHTCWTFFSRC